MIKKIEKWGCLILAALLICSCGKRDANTEIKTEAISIDDNYRTTYEIFVYSFNDSDGDGIGDLNGITQKLDYIGDGNEESAGLGCNQIWLTPIVTSPTYHKYDAIDFMAIDPQFGTMEDFENLVEACHEREIRVLFDLAVNHTSSEHPWFEEAVDYLKSHEEVAVKAADDGIDVVFSEEDLVACPTLSYYHFSENSADGYAPIEGTKWYYEARFWEGMPDLNLDNDKVREEIEKITAFWLEKGVDGFRLDAVTSYYTDHATENIAFLSWLCSEVKEQKSDAYLVGECWTDQSVYAKYYESGVDSYFDFNFAGQDGIIANVVRGSKSAAFYAKALESEEALYEQYNPDFVNAPFYTNHDMARSTGYYAYDDGSKTKLAGGLNLLMTGNATIYYGEEIGMKGSGKDENKRAPMLWSSEADDTGMCSGPPDMDDVQMKFDGVYEQQSDAQSIWNYYKNAISIRNRFPVIARGKTTVDEALSGDTVCVFTREMEDDSYDPVCVIINTGEESCEVNLSETEYGEGSIAASLLAQDGEVILENGVLTIPARGIAIVQ